MVGSRDSQRARVAPRPPASASLGLAAADAADKSEGLDKEVALLRRLIRRMAKEKDAAEARRQIETLCKVLRPRRALDDRAADSLSRALARTLEEIGRAMGDEA